MILAFATPVLAFFASISDFGFTIFDGRAMS